MLRTSTLFLVRAELAEQRADEPHPPVVGPAQPPGHVTVAAGPVPDCQLDGEALGRPR